MATMRAVVVDPDAPGHLAVNEVDRPVLAPNEVLVKAAAVSINQGEVRMAQAAKAGSKIGWDVAGTVEQPASDGSGPSAGTLVVGFVRTGAWAEFVAVPTDALAAIPDNVSFAQAATLPVAGLTALHSIMRGKSLLGRNVLITGANGGVGHFACQLAKLSGARVVGQIRNEKYRDMVASTGADEVVVSEDGSAAEEFGPYKLIADAVGGKVFTNTIGMLSQDGVFVSYGASAGAEVTFDLWDLDGAGRASLYGLVLFNELVREPASEGLARLVKLVSDGRLKPHITIEESWTKVGEVVQEFLARKVPGKAVLYIG